MSEYKFVPKFGPKSAHPIQTLSAHDPGFCQPKTRPSPEESSEVPGYSLAKEGVCLATGSISYQIKILQHGH